MEVVTTTWLLAILALGVFAVGQIAMARKLRRIRRHTCRFPMFAVRDELVRLVASGVMKESNKAWQLAYESCNSLLDMHRDHGLLRTVLSYLRYMDAVEQDQTVASQAELVGRRLKAATEQYPEFKKAMEQVASAHGQMIRSHTTWWQPLALALMAKVALGLRVMRMPRRSITDASAAELTSWQHSAQRC